MSTFGPIGCPVSPPSLSFQNVQSHEKSYTNYSALGETPTVSLRSRKPVTTSRGITWETYDTTRVSTTGRKAQNEQDDSSSVGCSRGSFFGLAKAEVTCTDFPSPSQLSVPFAEVETADSPPVGGVSPRCREQKNTGLPCISYSSKTKIVLRKGASTGRFFFVCHRVHIAFGVFRLCLPSMSCCVSPA